MIEVLDRHRGEVAEAISGVIARSAVHLDRVNEWAPDLRRRLERFAVSGKLLRGSLVAVGAEVFSRRPDADLYTVAAAVELVHSFLLIHDDIMDQDETRRGEAAVFRQYRDLGLKDAVRGALRFGESMAVCAGDVVALIAIEAITSSGLDSDLVRGVIHSLAREIADVGVAQMGDVSHSHRTDEVPEETIIGVYRYKTGRYTFSLPLTLGSMIARAGEHEIEQLARWGELQGIIFQIRDDEMGLMGTTQRIGKPVGSDISENKQTLHRSRLFAAARGTQWEPVLSYFGRPVSGPELEGVRQALTELNIPGDVRRIVDELNLEAAQVLAQMSFISPDARRILESIARFNAERTT